MQVHSRSSYIVGLFNQKLEFAILFLPLLFLVLTALETKLQFKYEKSQIIFLRFLSQTILLNGIHVVFTFAFMFFSKDFIKFTQEESVAANRSLYKRWLLFF